MMRKIQLHRYLVALWALSFFLLSAPAMALPQEDIDSIYRDSVHYAIPTKTCGTVSSGTALQGNDNLEKAWNFLTGKDFTDEQSAGILRNFMAESGGRTTINPKAENPIGAYGIAQWLGGRRTNLESFAQKANKPASDLGVQLDFFWSEMKGSESNAYTQLKKVTTKGPDGASEAAENFRKYYERNDAKDGSLTIRRTNAASVYKRYAGSSNVIPPTSGAAAIENSGCGAWSGKSTQFVDGFTIYNQCDPDWGNKPYGNGSTTICPSGCGPSAMAMIITNLTGKKVTPLDAAKYADQRNEYVSGQGSKFTIAPDLAGHWGLNAQKINLKENQINDALAKGGLVIIAGTGAEPFTTAGHFIVIRAVTAGGKWKIGNSNMTTRNKDTNTKEYVPSSIISQAVEGSVYAVYK